MRAELVGKCDLKKRRYLGPTSMDNELSLVMANLAQVRRGAVAFDPFVGTGSILLAAAQLGPSERRTRTNEIDVLVQR